MAGPLLTVGHGTHSQEEFLALVHGAAVEAVVDVRIAPGSRRYPHFGRSELSRWLPEAGIDYRWEKRLGGFRAPAPDSPDVGLRNESFRGYAGHMRGAEFRAAITAVLDLVEQRSTAVLCSESVWWRCHRRLIADHVLLLAELAVEHVLPDGRRSAHEPTPAARVVGDTLVYDGPDQSAASR